MKNLTNLLLTIALIFSFSASSGQGCNFYYPLVENNKFQLQSFDANDKLESIQEVHIKNVKTVGNAIEATIESKVYNSRNRLQHEGEFTVTCSDNEIKLDMSSLLDPSMMSGFEGMDVQMEVDNITIPSDLRVGSNLKDASMKIKVRAGGMVLTDMSFLITDRKVESIENISTPAGTFEAFKVSHSYIVKSEAMGMSHTVNIKSIEYLVKNIGVVRTETYDADGKLQGYTVLSKIH